MLSTRAFTAAALLLAAIATLGTGCATSRDVLATERARSNTQTVLAFEETVFNKHQVPEGFARFVGPSFRQHDPLIADGKDYTIKALSIELGSVFPNSRVIVKRTVAQGDLVAVHLLWDQKPGETRGVAMMELYRLEFGKIVEHWSVVQGIADAPANSNSMF